MNYKVLDKTPKQTRSQQTLARILSASTTLVGDKVYDDLSIAEIAKKARVSVGTIYTRFENKQSLLDVLRSQFGAETEARIQAALSRDWSSDSLQSLLRFIVKNNVELYEKYRGVLTTVHLESRVLNNPLKDKARHAHNTHVADSIEALILSKKDEIKHKRPRAAIRIAIACMASMLREAIVFNERSLYPKPGNSTAISRHVSNVMYGYLAGPAA